MVNGRPWKYRRARCALFRPKTIVNLRNMIEINRKTNRKILRLVFCVFMDGNSCKIFINNLTINIAIITL